VVDLTQGKTLVRGAQVECARMEEGDTLEVGAYSLSINYHRPLVRRPPVPLGMAPLVVGGEKKEPMALQPVLSLGKDESLLLAPLLQQFNATQQQMFEQFNQTLMLVVQMLTSMHQEQASLVREELRHFQNATEELRRLQEEAKTRLSQPFAPLPSAPRLSAPVATPFHELPPLSTPDSPSRPGSPDGTDDNIHGWLNDRMAALEAERQSSWQRLLGFLRGN
jgi:hypothetical protein